MFLERSERQSTELEKESNKSDVEQESNSKESSLGSDLLRILKNIFIDLLKNDSEQGDLITHGLEGLVDSLLNNIDPVLLEEKIDAKKLEAIISNPQSLNVDLQGLGTFSQSINNSLDEDGKNIGQEKNSSAVDAFLNLLQDSLSIQEVSQTESAAQEAEVQNPAKEIAELDSPSSSPSAAKSDQIAPLVQNSEMIRTK
ncbi:hypothetical protein N9O56_00775 [Rickettsiales bacterium]|nr:hypothetical protein [Rickettsiales bacterium]